MRYVSVDVLQQKWPHYTHEKWLPCVECGKAELRMMHLRLNPKGEHGTPIGGVYCRTCTITIMQDLLLAINVIVAQ